MPYVPFPAFDDDEEDPPVGFEQDPEDDDIGHGDWTYADGSKRYGAGDPELAKTLLSKSASMANGGAEEAPSLDDQFLSSTTGAERDENLPDEPQPLGGAAPEAPEQAQAPVTPPALPGARGPARYTDRSESTDQTSASQSNQSSISRTGSAQDLGEFQQQQGDIAQGYERQGQAQEQGANSVVAAQQQRKNALMQMAADKEAVTAAAQASAEARKAQVIKKYQEVDSRKTDINALWKDKGALGTTLGLLGVALRSLNATKFGGPNTALQSIQEQKRQNIQAQLDDRNSELRGLERELGSIEAAAPMLEARMNDALSKRIDAMTIDEKSATVLANAKTMKAQLETEKASKIAESAKAYYGTLAQQQSQGSQLGRTQGTSVGRDRLSGAGVGGEGGSGDPLEAMKKALEADKLMEERGLPKDAPERQAVRRMAGLQTPVGETAPERTNREQSERTAREEAAFSEDQAKAESAYVTIGELGTTGGLVRKDGKWTAPADSSVGWKVGKMTELKAARSAAIEGLGRLQSGGVITEGEAARFSDMLGNEESSQQEIATYLNSLETLVNTRRKSNRRDAPKGIPGSWKSKPEASP
jgi:hypothetical protein